MFQIMTRRVAGAMLAAACLLIATSAPAWGKPAIFEDLTLDAAMGKAGERERLLIVKGTAEWCGPCKMMDRTTWVDERVVEWIREHGLAIAVDVDERPEEARTLGIRAMPTIIVFRGEEEVGRFMGARDPRGTLAFLEAARTGQALAGAERPPPAPLPEGDGVRERYDRAQQLLRNREYEAATEGLLWLWNHTVEHEPSYSAVRGSFMAGSIRELAHAHPPAMEAFLAIRDQNERRLRDGSGTFDDLDDWVTLSMHLGREDDVLAWIERVSDDEQGIASIQRVGFRVRDMLIARRRLDLLSHTVRHAHLEAMGSLHIFRSTQAADAAYRAPRRPDPELDRLDAEVRNRSLRRQGTVYAAIYAALRSADRHDESDQYVRALFDGHQDDFLPMLAAGFLDGLREWGVEPPAIVIERARPAQ